MFLSLLLMVVCEPVFAQNGPVYSYIPQGASLQTPGTSGPLVDSRGFYMGYYQPAAPARMNCSGGGYYAVPAITNPLGTSANGVPSYACGIPGYSPVAPFANTSGSTVPQAYATPNYYGGGYSGQMRITNPLGIGTPAAPSQSHCRR